MSFKCSVIDTAEVPRLRRRSNQWGEFADVCRSLASLETGKCLRLETVLSKKQKGCLRSAAKYAAMGLSIRTTPDATYVWVRGKIEDWKKYQARKRAAKTA